MKAILKRLLIRLNRLFGRPYLVNHASKEVHDLRNEHVNCHLTAIRNYEFMSRKNAVQLMDLTTEYNGCMWCNKQYDADLKREK